MAASLFFPQSLKMQAKGNTDVDAPVDSDHELCSVCGARPRYSKGRKSYTTCGLACAAKLGASDKAKARLSNSGAPSRTNSACLMCWRASKRAHSHFCGRSCESLAEQKVPLLLEVPRGHVTFNKVADHFKDTWDPRTPYPQVRKVYAILERFVFFAGYVDYRAKINAQGHFPKSKNRRWHGTTRECNLGDPGNLNLCLSPACSLCSTIRTSFDDQRFVSGIYTSAKSNESNDYSNNIKQSSRRALLLTEVVVGKDIVLTRDEIPPKQPHGYDSVRVISRFHNGRMVDCDELVVYTNNAIRPVFLVLYG